MKPYPVHLVLSSGGVNCLSYIGAMRKMQEHNITFASVTTCSMASIFGACVAAGVELDTLEQRLIDFNFKRLKKKRKLLPYMHLSSYPFSQFQTPDFSEIISTFLGRDFDLSELNIPFSTAAIDIQQQRMLVYSSDTHPEMKISEIVKIATAIPPYYQAYEKGNRILVDAAIASKSPVWIATNYPGNYPIIVLKPAESPSTKYLGNFGKFLGRLISASVSSYDHFLMSQIPRAIQVDINCGDRDPLHFDLSKKDIKSLILAGQGAMENKLKDYSNNFNNILEVEEIKIAPKKEQDTAERAAALGARSLERFREVTNQRHQVFISYSEKDRPWLLQLQTFMKSVERFTGIKTWDNTNIKGGEDWKYEIRKALKVTRVAVFLVSAHFLASDLIQEEEMQYFLDVSKKERVSIIWVAVSSSLYEHTPLVNIQCANDPKQPLDQLPEGKQAETLTNICKNIIDLMV